MSHVALWKAIHEQARAWSGVPICATVAGQLPRNRVPGRAGLPGYLQELQAGGATLGSRPLQAGHLLPWWMQGMPTAISGGVEAELATWLPQLQRVEEAHRLTVAWLRSRMPGYPVMPAPQLAPGTPWTTDEYSWQLGWAREERGRGLQFRPAPEGVAERLGAPAAMSGPLADTARAVADALGATEEWARLAGARLDLTSDVKAALSQARGSIRERLSVESVDAHEPRLAIRRAQYRESVVSEEIERLDGAAREYADAFGSAERLIELAASDVFGQLLMYGAPQTVHAARVEFDGGTSSEPWVSFSAPELIGGTTGALLWVDDPLIADVVRVEGLNFSLDVTAKELVRCTAVILSETGQAWGGS